MKNLLRAGGIALLLGTLVLAGRSGSEPKKTPAPHTRIALINLSSVIKSYHKYQDFQAEIQEEVKKYQAKDQELRAIIAAAQKTIGDATTTAAQKGDGEKLVRDLMRQIEDNNIEAKTAVGKKSDRRMVLLYKKVQQAAQRYAQAHDIEIILHYQDADEKNPAEYWLPANVARKMQAGALSPLYMRPGCDITVELVDALNGGRRAE